MLVELNTDGITMVMVTHDPNVKHLAHRVVYMVDGKINHVETVPPLVRQAALRQLHMEAEVCLSTGCAFLFFSSSH